MSRARALVALHAALLSTAVVSVVGADDRRQPPPWEKPLQTGRLLFLENCSVCHEINSPKSKKLGPNLHRVFQKEKMPMSRVKPTDEYVANKIKTGSALMPAFREVLSERQVRRIVEYIRANK